MSGRRQPTDLVIAKGRKHLTKNEVGTRKAGEVTADPPKQIRSPAWLPDDLKPDFRRIAKQLIALKIFSTLDYDALGRYLVAHASWLEASGQAMIYLKRKDVEAAREWAAIQDKYFKQARACAEDLGLTISSRCKLVIPQVALDDDDDDDFLTPPGVVRIG